MCGLSERQLDVDIAIAKMEALLPYVDLLRELDGQDSQFAETAKQEVLAHVQMVWSRTEDPGSALDHIVVAAQGFTDVAWILRAIEEMAADAIDNALEMGADADSLTHRTLVARYAFVHGYSLFLVSDESKLEMGYEEAKAWVLETFPTLLDRSHIVQRLQDGWGQAYGMDYASQMPAM